MRTYAFRDMILSRVEGVANEMAEQGFSPQNIYKEGARMYVLFSKWDSEDDEVELSELDQVYEDMDDLSGRVVAVELALKLFGPPADSPAVASENTPMSFSEPEDVESEEVSADAE